MVNLVVGKRHKLLSCRKILSRMKSVSASLPKIMGGELEWNVQIMPMGS